MMALLDEYTDRLVSRNGGAPNLEDLFCLVDLFGGMKAPDNPDRQVLRRFIGRVCALAWQRHTDEEQRVCEKGEPRRATHTPAVQMRHYLREKTTAVSPNQNLTWDGAGSVCLDEAFLSQVLYGERATLRDPALAERPDHAANAIISLNYDLIIEREARRFDRVQVFYGEGVLDGKATLDPKTNIVPARRSLSDGPCLPLIKLHGSLNWLDPGSDNPILRCADEELVGDATPLILPTWQRSAIGTARSAALLREARIHLRLASTLVFVGYSMPATDVYLRYLFTESMAVAEFPKVAVCNPAWSETQARERCREMLGPRIPAEAISAYAGLSEYVSAFNPEHSLA